MRIWKKWTIIAITAASIGTSAYIYASAKNHGSVEVEAAAVKRGDIESDVSCSGVIQTQNRSDYYAYSPLIIEKMYVKVGDRVKTGELLVRFEAQDLTPQLEQAYAQVEIASSTLAGLEKQKDEENDKVPSGIAGLDIGMGKSFDIDTQIEIQEKQLEIAQIELDSIKDKINSMQTEIKSSMSGVVTAVNGAGGSLANAGVPVVSIEDPDNIKAVINVSQYDAANIREGQEAVITIGDSKKDYRGIVKKVNPTAKKIVSGTSAETAVPVDIEIKNPDTGVRIGYDVDVNIKTSFRPGVLYIPNEAIIDSKDKGSVVYTVHDGRVSIRAVKAGIESDFYTEITEGLTQGEDVILNPPRNLKDGSFVSISH